MVDEVTTPRFAVGDRCFSHYTMKWGTVRKVGETTQPTPHGVTGAMLPGSTWYTVESDDSEMDMLDDANGEWALARIVPPHIAKRYGYGDDPKGA